MNLRVRDEHLDILEKHFVCLLPRMKLERNPARSGHHLDRYLFIHSQLSVQPRAQPLPACLDLQQVPLAILSAGLVVYGHGQPAVKSLRDAHGQRVLHSPNVDLHTVHTELATDFTADIHATIGLGHLVLEADPAIVKLSF